MQTLQEIKDSPKEILTPTEVAGVLRCDPYSINLQAQKDPSKLGFPVIVIGRRVKIPKAAFIRFVEGLQQRNQSGEEAANKR